MRHQTGIQWTHVPGYIGATWNPTTGCTRVSAGCDHCYAFTLHDQRYKTNLDDARTFYAYQDEPPPPDTTAREVIAGARVAGVPLPFPAQYDVPFSQVQELDERRLTEPLRAKRPHAYFVDSMSDLFHADVPDSFIDRVFAVMALSPQHVFMVLTKRPERMRAYLSSHEVGLRWALASERRGNEIVPPGTAVQWTRNGLPNVWLGVTVEDQARADERIPLLLDTPAAVRFLSCEPLLEAIDLTRLTAPADGWADTYNALDGTWENVADKSEAWLRGVDWVIVGGESGKGARRFDLAWARSLRDQCAAAGVPFFMKQMGSRPTDIRYSNDPPDGWALRIKLKHSHGANPDEWPEDLRVRQWPAAGAEVGS
jgi:protein gp37